MSRAIEVNPIGPNLVANPALCGDGETPDGWEFWTPREELAPGHRFERGDGADGGGRLVLEATGDRRAFGCWRGEAPLEVGQWYRASIQARVRTIANPELAIFAQMAQHYLVVREATDGTVRLEQVFRHRTESDGNRFEVYLRATERGSVELFGPEVVPIERPQFRKARVATVRFGTPEAPLTLEGQRERMAQKLDEAGALRADIVALTEFCPVAGVQGPWIDAAETVPDGPVCRLLAEKARQHHMYVLCGIIERRGKYIFNTAVLFDREGRLAGQYDKTHLTFSELTMGISCGDSYPVFDLDFGRIGVHICYDEWFPEVARYYAQEGVEVLFLPVMGGKPITWRTRALDNGMHFVASSVNPPSMIIESSGVILSETHDDGIAVADLNLDVRETNWYRDPTQAYGMPCTVPQMRHCLDNSLIEGLSRAMLDAGRP